MAVKGFIRLDPEFLKTSESQPWNFNSTYRQDWEWASEVFSDLHDSSGVVKLAEKL
jgi:hypothetical protein